MYTFNKANNLSGLGADPFRAEPESTLATGSSLVANYN